MHMGPFVTLHGLRQGLMARAVQDQRTSTSLYGEYEDFVAEVAVAAIR